MEYVLSKGGTEILKQREDWGSADLGERIILARLLPTGKLASGTYEIAIRIRDRVTGQALSLERLFTIEDTE